MIDNPEIKKIYAYHEAAHALMAVLQSNYLILSQLSLTPQGFVGGVFLASPKIDECLHDNSVEMRSYRHDERINQTKNNIMIYLAGGISHEILNGEKLSFKDFELKYRNEIGYPGLTGSDIDIVVELLKYYSIFKDFSLVSNVQNDLEQYSIPYSIPSQEERELLVNNLLEECYEDTYRILYENKDLLDKVAILALQKGIISGDIIYEMAGIKRPKYDFELSSVEKASRIIINWLSWTAKRVAFYDRHYSNLQDL